MSNHRYRKLVFTLISTLTLSHCGGGSGRSPQTAMAPDTGPVLDNIAPSTPARLDTEALTYNRVLLAWSAATDNRAVTAYKIYRNNEVLARVNASLLSYEDMTVAPEMSYSYAVSAGDAAGNWSPPKFLNIRTPPLSLRFTWLPPSQRVNGDALAPSEIGGYELRYRGLQSNEYISTLIANNRTETTLTGLKGDYSFEIAAFDTENLYSDFSAISPH